MMPARNHPGAAQPAKRLVIPRPVSDYPQQMRDIDIRVALDSDLRRDHGHESNTIIRHEFGLQEGRRRIDVALLNGHLGGWEIKSDVDTLVRLAGQADVYGKVLDFVTIVTTARYVERATAMLPAWWGVIVAERLDDVVHLEQTRVPELNTDVDAMSLAQLLWRDEAIQLLRELGEGKGLSSKARWYAWDRLVQTLTLDELRTAVRQQIKARREWPGGQLSMPSGATSHTHASA
jgi:hypothetical protein